MKLSQNIMVFSVHLDERCTHVISLAMIVGKVYYSDTSIVFTIAVAITATINTTTLMWQRGITAAIVVVMLICFLWKCNSWIIIIINGDVISMVPLKFEAMLG